MAIKSIEKPESKLQETYYRFWGDFNYYTAQDIDFNKEFKVHPRPSVRAYQDYCIGQPFHIVAGINFKRKEIRIGAYFRDLICYHFWYNHGKRWIESCMNRRLEWKEFNTKGSVYTHLSTDFNETGDWHKAFPLMVENMIRLKKAFMEDVKL